MRVNRVTAKAHISSKGYPSIRAVHVVIGGFQQDLGDHTGSDRLWRSLHYKYSGPRTLVVFLEWHDPVASLARHIWHQAGENGETVYVTIAAYSWGVATGARLARELRRLGIIVDSLVSADGIYRWRWMFWRVFFRWPRIVVSNVRHVVPFRQKLDWPFGHKLVAEDSEVTEIEDTIWADRGHTAMDEFLPFHMAAKSAARRAQEKAGLVEPRTSN